MAITTVSTEYQRHAQLPAYSIIHKYFFLASVSLTQARKLASTDGNVKLKMNREENDFVPRLSSLITTQMVSYKYSTLPSLTDGIVCC